MKRARSYAIAAHGDQKYGDHPYVYHLDKVAELVAPFGEEAVTLAYLHDVVEDVNTVDLLDIANIFGEQQAMLVGLVTDEPGANRKERKRKTNQKLARVDENSPFTTALIVKVGDRLANVRESFETGNKSKQLMYADEHVEFRKATYRQDLCESLWEQLGRYLDPNDGHILTRMEKRGLIYPRGILQVCQDVHMASTGACERNEADQRDDVRLLRVVLDTWNHGNECAFDMAVKTLVGITIAEATQ